MTYPTFFCHSSGKIPRNFSGVRIFHTKSTDVSETKAVEEGWLVRD